MNSHVFDFSATRRRYSLGKLPPPGMEPNYACIYPCRYSRRLGGL